MFFCVIAFAPKAASVLLAGSSRQGWNTIFEARQMIQISRKAWDNDQHILKGNYCNADLQICSYILWNDSYALQIASCK